MMQDATQSVRPAVAQEYHFCTYFDRNYLTRGLALYRSLETHFRRHFTLWIVCFDDECYERLDALQLPRARLVRRGEFEQGDAGLAGAKQNRTSVEYFWTCTPSVPLFLFRRHPEIGLITYLDADLFFFSDPEPLFRELGAGSILIGPHRYAPEHAHFAKQFGIYNVGLMMFRRDADALECLQWWRERCLEWCYARLEDGKFGDQKYLDDWPERFRGVVVLQHRGAGVAPWNISTHAVARRGGRVDIDGLPLVFYHFHGLQCVSPRMVLPHGECYRMTAVQMDVIYRTYARQLSAAATSVVASFRDSFVAPLPRRERLRGLLRQQYFLTAPRWLSMLLWWSGRHARSSDVHLERAEACLNACRRPAGAAHLLAALAYLPVAALERRYASALMRVLVGDAQIVRYRRWMAHLRRAQH